MKVLILIFVAVAVVSAYFYYDFSPADTPAEVPEIEIVDGIKLISQKK